MTSTDAPSAEAPAPRCPVCSRELRSWPIERGARCSPKTWAYCIRPFKN